MGRHTKKTPPKATLALEHLPEIILGFESDKLAPTSPLADIPSSLSSSATHCISSSLNYLGVPEDILQLAGQCFVGFS
jgi:hypothetical protein